MSVDAQYKEAAAALETGVSAVLRIVRERDEWRRRCAEETIAWVEQVKRADEAERVASVRLDRLMQMLEQQRHNSEGRES